MVIIHKQDSTVSDGLAQQKKEDRQRRFRLRRNKIESDSTLAEIDDDMDSLRKARRKDKGGYHRHEHDAMQKHLEHRKFLADYDKRMKDRSSARQLEQSDIQKARALEDASGTGNNFKRSIQDAKLNAKYKLQDWSDNYFKATEGRSLGGDIALAGAAVGAGYLAHKAIKKAKYDKEQAKLQAEKKFKKG